MKKILVTGATDGIGRVTALRLAQAGNLVTIVGRHPEKTALVTKAIAAAIPKGSSGTIDSLLADLSRPAETRRVAHEFLEKNNCLDVLVNNAGGMFENHETTLDGFERTFALNHLSYFHLTQLLLPALRASPRARIVNVASEAHRGCSLDFDVLEGKKPIKYSAWRAYQRSKLANILFTRELARQLHGTGVTANCLHPGFVATKFGHNNSGFWGKSMRLAQAIFAIDEEAGARTSIFLAMDPSVDALSGGYYSKCKIRKPSYQARSDDHARRLWEITVECLKPFT
jgi:retinol dehydrogenase-12